MLRWLNTNKAGATEGWKLGTATTEGTLSLRNINTEDAASAHNATLHLTAGAQSPRTNNSPHSITLRETAIINPNAVIIISSSSTHHQQICQKKAHLQRLA